MRSISYLIIAFFLLIFSMKAISQTVGLEGRWEGLMGDELLQINLIEKKGVICGYTYDFRLNAPDDHCKAYFTASFSKEINAWILDGNEFIENSGTHVFMQIRFREKSLNGKRVIHGIVLPQSSANSGNELNYIEVFLERKELPVLEREKIRQHCFPTKSELKKLEKQKEIQEKEPEPSKNDLPPVTDTASSLPLPSVTPNSAVTEEVRVEEMRSRKKNEVSTLKVNNRNINIKVYDNGIIDDDTVTIYFNNKLLVDKKRLSDRAIEFFIQLEDRPDFQEIIMYAENLGSIPPNTALMVVTAGDKRYELYASASMEENAVLRFEYSPK